MAEWAYVGQWAEWVELLRLSLPNCLSVCLEWWWYELMTIAAGYLRDPHTALATAAIVIQTTSLMYTIPVTLSLTVSARQPGSRMSSARDDQGQPVRHLQWRWALRRLAHA